MKSAELINALYNRIHYNKLKELQFYKRFIYILLVSLKSDRVFT